MSTKPVSSTSSPEAESIISRTLLGPVLFVSFIVSLFFVDQQTSAEIFESNARTDTKHEHEHYYHSHQLAKKEFDDAFALRKRVIAAMCVAGGISLAGLGWFLTKAWAMWGYQRSPSSIAL
jgi:mannitol-specific phosphotransferase system IIBC component